MFNSSHLFLCLPAFQAENAASSSGDRRPSGGDAELLPSSSVFSFFEASKASSSSSSLVAFLSHRSSEKEVIFTSSPSIFISRASFHHGALEEGKWELAPRIFSRRRVVRGRETKSVCCPFCPPAGGDGKAMFIAPLLLAAPGR